MSVTQEGWPGTPGDREAGWVPQEAGRVSREAGWAPWEAGRWGGCPERLAGSPRSQSGRQGGGVGLSLGAWPGGTRPVVT